MRSKFFMIFYFIFFSSCLDVFTDYQYDLRNGVFIIYSSGDGFRLVEGVGGSNYSDIIPTTIIEIYSELDGQYNILLVKANSLDTTIPFSYFKVKIDPSIEPKYDLSIITESEYLTAVKQMNKINLRKIGDRN